MVKVLDFMGLTYPDLYAVSRQAQIKRATFYKENTSVLAYYVIQTILMNDYQNFIVWCDKHHFSLFDFKKTISHQREFCEYIKDHYKTKTFLDSAKKMEELVKKMKTTKKHKTNQGLPFLMNSMRMTAFEPTSNTGTFH
jgi:hypothetical protein